MVSVHIDPVFNIEVYLTVFCRDEKVSLKYWTWILENKYYRLLVLIVSD